MGRSRPGWLLRRSGRRTNLALLVVLVGAFGSGWVAFAGGPASWLSTAAHGLFGIGVIALLPWKSAVVGRATRLRVVSLILLVVLVGCLLAGFVQLFAGYVVVAGVTPIQVHVGAALIAAPPLVWHVRRSRRQRPRAADLSRRALLQDGALAAGVGLGYGLAGVTALVTWPARPRAETGSRPVSDAPATIWLFDRTPQATTGAVLVAGVPVALADLRARAETVRARLDCTNGWYADEEWTGVPLSAVIPTTTLAGAAGLRVRSVTGYDRVFPVGDAGRLWLATGVGGSPLTEGRGAPVRLVAPGRRGFWWVKWVGSVELDERPSWLQPPFPLQ